MINDNVLVLGANGFIGKNIIEFLSKEGYLVHALDKNGFVFNENDNIKSINISISETTKLRDYIEKENIKIVIHLVSSMLPSSSVYDFHREMDDIVIPTFRLIDVLSELNIKFIYFSSGGTIYGQSEQPTLKEETQCHPTSYYGYSKLIVEEYVNLINRKTNLPYLILRPSNPYGRYQNPKKNQGFIAVALDKIMKNENIEIWGNGSIIRDYIYIDDLCRVLVDLLLNNIINMTLNIGTGCGHSLLEIAKIIASVTGKDVDIIFKEARKVDINKIVLDVGRLQSFVSFKPKTVLTGIESFYSFLQGRGN